MFLRTLFFAAIFYIINLVLLTVWPLYTDLWAQFAYATAGVNAISWTIWATTAEWGRLLLVAILTGVTAWLTGKWAAWQDAAADEDVDEQHAASVRRALDALGRTRGEQRLEIIEAYVYKLPNGLTTHEAVALLGALRHAERVSGIKLLRHRLSPNVVVSQLASGLTDAERAEVVQALP